MLDYSLEMTQNESETLQFASVSEPQRLSTNTHSKGASRMEKSSRALFIAADLGAGNIKIRTSKRGAPFFSMPSLIAKVKKESVEEGDRKIYNADVFHIGDDIFWFAGESVIDRKLTSDNPGQDANLKVENAPYFLMSALILGGYVQAGSLNKVGVVLSHHASDEMGAALRAKIEGEKTVTHNGLDYQMIFHLPEQGVYQEGAKICAVNQKHGILDLGYLTGLYTRRSGTGAILYSDATDAGVNKLVDMICADGEFRSLLGGVNPDRDRVVSAIFDASKAIESGNTKVPLIYRAKGKAIDIKTSYKRCLVGWLQIAASKADLEIKEEAGSGFKVIAIGGGARLPGIAGVLKMLKIEIYEGDPIFANCDSLYRSVVRSAIRDKAFEGWFDDQQMESMIEPALEVEAVG